MIIKEKSIKIQQSIPIVIGIDFEWTKNYKIKNGNVPFCFSIVYFPMFKTKYQKLNNFEFGFKSVYVNNKNENNKLIDKAVITLNKLNSIKNKIIVGHQLHSDIGVIDNYSMHQNNEIKIFKDNWKNRQNFDNMYFDTRYDINNLKCKSRRLVDVCNEYNINVEQPEIKGSMSKMHNEFILNHDTKIMEKLAIMNLRHSLSCALLYTSFKLDTQRTIYTNNILYNNVKNYFNYVNSEDFSKLLK